MSGIRNSRSWRTWLLAIAASLLIHGMVLVIFSIKGMDPEGPRPETKKFTIDLSARPKALEARTSEAGTSPNPAAYRSSQEAIPSRFEARSAKKTKDGAKPLRDAPIASVPSGPASQLATGPFQTRREIRIWPSESVLQAISREDLRVRRRQASQIQEEIPETGRRTEKLPEKVDPYSMKEILDTVWQPSWDQIKDPSLAEVSGPWMARLARDWYTAWQQDIQRMGSAAESVPREPLPEDDMGSSSGMMLKSHTLASDVVRLRLGFEPLRDGTWFVALLSPSGHPFFDSSALAEAREAAGLFPPWPEGYGWALRFSIEARYVIVPPVPAVGLAWNADFSDPEAIYPLKRMLRKHIRFEGADAPRRLSPPKSMVQ